ncbi:MAG TPA: UDP-glucose 4-epimerase GalE [Chthonomonadaceae bacterium]|nr:UDP-glucose 4-epimerase GalE [Chthonomonadaceae bacterium]
MKILVTGAAGYIGSVVTELLIEEGHRIVAMDNLAHGHRAAVHPDATFVQLDLLDAEGLKRLVAEEEIEAVVHLAAEALIDESIRNPGRFFRANTTGGINLLDAMSAAGVKRIVFSSTAAVYGQPKVSPIPEDAPKEPVNSYGESKLAFERIMAWYRVAFGLNHISLRYFNASGATERYGEFHVPETHLIPIVFEAALGERESMRLFGTDYPTPDGSCVRDYVHVADIARAHILALQRIDTVGAAAYNLGNGSGYTNKQVIATVEEVTGRKVQVVPTARRPGDPAVLVAGAERIRQDLGWQPRIPDLATIVETAWRWRQKYPRGYDA